MEYQMVGDKVLIRPDKIDSKSDFTTASGIVIKGSEETRPKGRMSLGEIVNLGSSYVDSFGTRVPLSDVFKVGDKVLYYHAAEVQLEDDLIAIRAIDIDCIVQVDEGEEVKIGR